MQDSQHKIISKQDITIHSYENTTVENIPEFLKKIDAITHLKENSIIQLLDADYICGQKHLNQGITQAIKAFEEKQNFAKDKGLEICLRLSAQKQINQALKMLGIKKQGNITVIYINTSIEQIQSTEKLLGTRNDELLEKYDPQKICDAYNLSTQENLVENINEKIALLALKN